MKKLLALLSFSVLLFGQDPTIARSYIPNSFVYHWSAWDALMHFLGPLFQTRQLNSNVTGGGPAIGVYPESYNQGDGTSGINTALSTLMGSGVCTPAITCILVFQGKTYTASTTIIFNGSYITMQGQNGFADVVSSSVIGSTVINTTSSTTNQLTETGNINPGSSCINGTLANTQGVSQRIIGIAFTRTTPATSGDGIYSTLTCVPWFVDVTVWDSINGFHFKGVAHITMRDDWVQFSAHSNTSRNGVYFDSSSGVNGANESSNLRGVYTGGDGSQPSNITGFLLSGPSIADTFLDDIEASATDYGIQISSTTNPSSINYANGDIHITHAIFDGTYLSSIYINNVYGGGVPYIEIGGGYFNKGSQGVIQINNAKSVNIHGAVIQSPGSGQTAIVITGANSGGGNISGNIMQLTGTCVSISNSGDWNLTGNQCKSDISGYPIGTGYVFVNSSNNNIHGNTVEGTFTYAASFDGSSTNNSATGNGWAASTILNAGSGNDFGPLGIFTVSTLPTCNTAWKGSIAQVSDALAPTFLGSLTGSSSTFTPVVCNGAAWVAY